MRKVLFFILCLLSVNLSAQRLNSDGLKMVSKLSVYSVGRYYYIDFLYKENYLNKLIFTYVEESRNLDKSITKTVYRDILIKEGNTINQKSYLDGKPYNKFKYKYQFNDNSKLVRFDVYEYTPIEYIFRRTNEFIYRNDTISEIHKHSSWIKDGKWCYDPDICVNFIEYRENIWNLIWKEKQLTNEQVRKYAPLYTEDEFMESKDNLEEKDYGYTMTFEYSDNVNNTNICLNGLFNIEEIFLGNSSSKLSNILYFTEWVGIREAYLATKSSTGGKIYDITYKYDTKGNIVQVDYISTVKYINNMKINIEYVPE